MVELYNAILPHVVSREHQLLSEFSFWPSSPPRDSGFPGGGIFELRSYQLVPGKLLEWEGAWRRGLEARRRFVVGQESFPADFSNRLEPSSRKLDSFTKSTTYGSTREYAL